MLKNYNIQIAGEDYKQQMIRAHMSYHYQMFVNMTV